MNIGFVLANKPQTVPRVVQLLANSYNSHVRYGAAAAIGIACAATGNAHAISVLKKMYTEDTVDYVKQAALMSLGMVLQQQNEKETPAVKEVREDFYLKAIKAKRKRKHDMNVMGAIYGMGLMDAGGRNAIISLCGASGTQKRMSAIIGMALFWQHWYWYPLVAMITLAFKPTFVMALNKDLRMPAIEYRSEAPASQFAYPEKIKEEDLKSKVETVEAVLSITAKSKARALKRQQSRAATSPEKSVDVDMTEASPKKDETAKQTSSADDKSASKTEDVEMSDADVKKEGDDEKKEEKEEPFEMLSNPSRVTLNQQKVVRWSDTRFAPIRGKSNDGKPLTGVIMVEDSKPTEDLKLVEEVSLASGGVHGDEPQPPAPFKYMGP
jgi:26S proteasome regulatory subunit N2